MQLAKHNTPASVRRTITLTALTALVVGLSAGEGLAITLGQVDEFLASSEGWFNPAGTAVHVANDGVDGPDDGFLRITTSGFAAGSGSRIISKSSGEWLGDYLSEGVDLVTFYASNFSDEEMIVRLGFRGGGGTFVTTGQTLPANSGWTPLSFSLAESNFDIAGDYAGTFSSVSELRVIHRIDPNVPNGGPADAADVLFDPSGLPFVGILGIDNVLATRVPEPTTALLGAWLAMPACGLRRRR